MLYLDLLQDVDLARYAQQLGQLVANADPWLLGVAVSVLVGIGHKLAVGNRIVYGWGLRLAALAFLGYFGVAVWQTGSLDQVITAAVLARAGILAGAVLAVIWILLPIILFVYGNFRFGLAGFVGYMGYALLTAEAIESQAMPGVALRGLLVAGLAMVLAWILRPIWEFVGALWLANKPVAAVAGADSAPVPEKAADVDPRLQRLERRQRRLARMQARQTRLANDPVPAGSGRAHGVPTSLDSPEGDLRRRRERARLDVELAYLLALPQLGSNFPRPLFDGWVVRYLGNQLSADEVEENSWHMQKALRQYHPQTDAGQANLNLEELHSWFLDEQRRIQALHTEPAVRQANLLALQELYVSLSQRFLSDPPAAVVQLVRPAPVEKLALPEAIGAR